MSPPAPDKENPYAAPVANLDLPGANGDQAEFDSGGKSVGVGQVVGWYARAFDMFKNNALMWVLMVVVFMVLYVVLMVIPLVNLAALAMFPVAAGGFMLGCAAIDRGEPLRFEHMFEGFQKHFGPLAMVGLLYLAAVFVVVVICGIGVMIVGLSSFGALSAGGKAGLLSAILTGGMGFLLIFLVAMALLVPVSMVMWFAPVLVVMHQMQPVDAMKASFSGCLKNVFPFLLYGVLYLVLAFVATLPFYLGWLVLGPVIIASIYTSYQDIYLTRN